MEKYGIFCLRKVGQIRIHSIIKKLTKVISYGLVEGMAVGGKTGRSISCHIVLGFELRE